MAEQWVGRYVETDLRISPLRADTENMAPEGRWDETRMKQDPLRRLKVVGAASLAVLVVVAMTIAFTNASGTRSIANDSAVLHWSNVTSGVAAVTRGSINQAMIFAIDERVGVSSPEATDVAIEEARSSLAALDELTRRVPTVLVGTGVEVSHLTTDGRDVVAALDRDDTDAAIRILDDRFEPRYGAIASDLGAAQAEYAGRIESAESGAARIEAAMRWIVTLLIPGVAVVLYRAILRKRYRRSEIEFRARIRAEQRINAGKDEFIAAISHELRTPLTTIVGFSEFLLESEVDDPNELRELLTLINSDSEELARMVDDLLTAAQVDGGRLHIDTKPTDLRTEAEIVAQRFSSHSTCISVHGDAPIALADSTRVRQVVRSLLSNAIRHGREPIEIHVQSSPAGAKLIVVDHGDGVPPDLAKRLFLPFVHESKDTLLTGTVGLGLAIARSLAQAMAGDLSYERSASKSRFSLSLPSVARVTDTGSSSGSSAASVRTIEANAS